MTDKITINPVTRIEGHAKITISLNTQGFVENAFFHVTQFRGFEKFCQGRPFYEMPTLMARTCGICSVSHLIAGGKACDELLSVEIPSAAKKLRKIFNLGQLIQSHALSFFYLSAPDIFLGMDEDPQKRNIVGLLEKYPDFTKDGIKLRKMGQSIIDILAGKRIHPFYVVPGGVNQPISQESREEILGFVPEIIRITKNAINLLKEQFSSLKLEIGTFGNFPTLFMGLVDNEGKIRHYEGSLRVVDSSGNLIKDKLNPANYADFIGEKAENWSFMKFPYFKDFGYPEGAYRVGPLARLNVCSSCGTPEADIALKEFRQIAGYPALSSFYYHWARLIEIIYAGEKIGMLLDDPDIVSNHICADAGPNCYEGVGVSEAPRGILIHHYKIDENGLITWANLVIATGHNNLSMNHAVLQVARQFIKGDDIKEGFLNRIEAVIRAYDPCLSCATHSVGRIAPTIAIINHKGEIIREI